jgi:hypothetical protein
LANADSVFKMLGAKFGERLKRIPDGETGDRQHWVFGSVKKFHDHPLLEPDGHSWSPDSGTVPDRPPKYRLKNPESTEALEFASLGYSKAAINSYKTFLEQRDLGIIPAKCKFQVGLPTPFSFAGSMISLGSQISVESGVQARLFLELEEILSNIRHQDLAIQWDVALELLILAGTPSDFDSPMDQIVERLSVLGSLIPVDVELGYHLCYGDFQHRHSIEPTDMNTMVSLSNSITQKISRPINWIHMPVPIERDDSAYFEALGKLEMNAVTEIYLGLLHFRDQIEGAQRRMRSASHFLEDYGISAECGFGRRPVDTIEKFLQLHVDASELK